MIAGLSAEEKKVLRLPSTESFCYLNQSKWRVRWRHHIYVIVLFLDLQGEKVSQIGKCDENDASNFQNLRVCLNSFFALRLRIFMPFS